MGGRCIGQFESAYAGQIGTVAYAIQGNVLTGEPVVLQAVQAAIATDSDLAGKLMAAMQAARLMGGDGRCSCSAGVPTSCGAPPPSFTKSGQHRRHAHRPGPTEGSNGIYRTAPGPAAVLPAEVTGDGRRT